jgi:DNA-binding NtrC family response regulator
LVHSYLNHFSTQTGKPVSTVATEAMEVLESYDWPGNVRELVNTMERSVLLADSEEIGLADLPTRVRAGGESTRASGEPLYWQFASLPKELLDKSLIDARKEVVSAFEFRYLSDLLTASGGRIGEAASRACINERSLYDMMKRRGLRKEDFKSKSRGRGTSGSRS